MDKQIKRIQRFFSTDDKDGGRKYLAFFIFLGLSSVLWLFNALKEEYKGTISYPVEYINFPKNKIQVNDLPEKLNITVISNGYKLLHYKLNPQLQPIIYNLDEYSMRKISGGLVSEFYLLTSPAVYMIEEQLGKDYRVLDIQPDTLFFKFTDMVARRVQIMPDVSVECEKPFRLYDKISVSPDSMLITGPGYIIDTLDYVYTKHYTFSGLDRTLIKSVQLSPIKRVNFKHKKAEITIPVEEYTENSFEIPITKLNVPDSIALILFPEKVKITYMVALSDYEKVNASHFNVTIDYGKIDPSGSNRIRIATIEYPEIVQNVTCRPTSVEFLKERR